MQKGHSRQGRCLEPLINPLWGLVCRQDNDCDQDQADQHGVQVLTRKDLFEHACNDSPVATHTPLAGLINGLVRALGEIDLQDLVTVIGHDLSTATDQGDVPIFTRLLAI